MKLQSNTGSMVVDYYPIQTLTGEVSQEWFLKTLTFLGEIKTERLMNRIEMNLDVEEYLNHTLPYEVVDFNTSPKVSNSIIHV